MSPLQGLNNRKHIYQIHTKLSYKDYEKRLDQKAKEEREKKEREEKELRDFMFEMSEEEYENLAESEKEKIDAIRLAERRERTRSNTLMIRSSTRPRKILNSLGTQISKFHHTSKMKQ